MTIKVYVDRSRIETHQRCHRLRWYEYHQGGMGLRSSRQPLPLAVGGAVHVGMGFLLQEGQKAFDAWPDLFHSLHGKVSLLSLEEAAVKCALADFAQFQDRLDAEGLGEGNETDPELAEAVRVRAEAAKGPFERYLFKEQSALVEGIVRAYARRRLQPLLEQFEVLEVEREGEWCLHTDLESEESAHARGAMIYNIMPSGYEPKEIWFMSRPDALLRERDSNSLYIMSFKTSGKWDYRKEKDAEHDMQGLSEGVEIERRLGEWWTMVQQSPDSIAHFISGADIPRGTIMPAMVRFLRALPTPPRILGIRYEFLLKGDRWTDKELTAKLGVEVRSQRSPLVRAYKNEGMAAGDEQWCVSWDYVKPGGEMSKLNYRAWKSAPVWESMSIKKWIDLLDATAETTGEEGAGVGWSGPAQATGFLTGHPLDDVFLTPITIYRNLDELRDWVEQVEAQEIRVAEGVAEVNATTNEDERRSALNRNFPMARRACQYPSQCPMVPLCFGGEAIRSAPLSSGLYTIRVANHPAENEK